MTSSFSAPIDGDGMKVARAGQGFKDRNLSCAPKIGQRRKLLGGCLLILKQRRSAMTKRKQHKPKFKARVALEALKGEQTVCVWIGTE